MMNRLFVGTMVIGAALMSSGAVYAEPAGVPTPVHAAKNAKMVHFAVRNDSKAPMTVTVGGNEMTFQPGKTISVKLAVGTQFVAQSAGTGYEAGSLLAVVSPMLNSATLVLK